ncbi:plasmid stabilization system protein ParE [Rhizobium sp. BK538]|nr:plasmid stabilization system protein ParE [Rhizobium sp. BK538]
MKVTWSAFALSDRDGIFSRIEAENAVAAIAVDQPSLPPHRGYGISLKAADPVGSRTRELVVTGTSYIAAYQIVGETIRILRVLHGAQRWPDELPS